MAQKVIHELKTWPEYFKRVFFEQKRFELRKNDRNYTVVDILWLKEFDPATNEYTGKEVQRIIEYILFGTPETELNFGLKDGYCIMSIA